MEHKMETKNNYLITTEEAARMLGVSIAFLERDRWAGPSIPFVKVGARAVRYRREDLEKHIKKNMKTIAEPVGG